jgi:hypothetical protein
MSQLSVTLSNHITIPPFTDIRELAKQSNLRNDYTGGRECEVDITEYVKGCADCQRHKVNTRPTKAPLQPIYPKAETTPFRN